MMPIWILAFWLACGVGWNWFAGSVGAYDSIGDEYRLPVLVLSMVFAPFLVAFFIAGFLIDEFETWRGRSS